MDATRLVDGTYVMLKLVHKSDHPFEGDIGLFLRSGQLNSDPRNHCVPIYEVLQIPDDENATVIVMPLLRPFDNPKFQTCGEVMDFLRQVFEASFFNRFLALY
jgi:hypothetical protein